MLGARHPLPQGERGRASSRVGKGGEAAVPTIGGEAYGGLRASRSAHPTKACSSHDSIAASSVKLPTMMSGWCGVSPNGRLRRSLQAVRLPYGMSATQSDAWVGP